MLQHPSHQLIASLTKVLPVLKSQKSRNRSPYFNLNPTTPIQFHNISHEDVVPLRQHIPLQHHQCSPHQTTQNCQVTATNLTLQASYSLFIPASHPWAERNVLPRELWRIGEYKLLWRRWIRNERDWVKVERERARSWRKRKRTTREALSLAVCGSLFSERLEMAQLYTHKYIHQRWNNTTASFGTFLKRNDDHIPPLRTKHFLTVIFPFLVN